jgi:glucose-1-phosphate adenylyltransferase
MADSVIGLRSRIGLNVTIRSSVIMGADHYETDAERAENERHGRPDIGSGQGTTVEDARIDKNARIGRNVQIRALADRPDAETENWVARDGLVIVPKNATIPDGTII